MEPHEAQSAHSDESALLGITQESVQEFEDEETQDGRQIHSESRLVFFPSLSAGAVLPEQSLII